ncbi:MAG: hypothetical protein P8L83_04340 [Flavobacteriaceae bacterium]|nr:hypothetical protein [Flavobacteriaceae bacterium]
MKIQIIPSIILFVLIVSCSKGGEPEVITSNTEVQVTIASPGKVILNSPDNNKVCEEGTSVSETESSVSFGWSKSDDTESYDLKITNLDNLAVVNLTGITETNKSVTLSKAIPYSWQITSKNQGLNNTASDVWKFYLAGDGVSNYAPFPAAPISPMPGATIDPLNGKVVISWESADPDGDTVNYTLYFDSIDGNQEPAQENLNLIDSSLEVDVNSDTVYYWKVITSDGSNTATSIVYTFRTS